MSYPTQIIDGGGEKNKATVTRLGQLVVSPVSYDDTVFNELAAANTAYNFYGPKVNKQFIITGFIAKADKQVSSTVDADVVIYEAIAADTTASTKTLFRSAMVQGDQVEALPLNIKVSNGVYVNAKTTDDDIHMTIMGYYINKID